MANMGYCRFTNTLGDLRDCLEHWDEELSEEEGRSRAALLEICEEVVAWYGEDDD